MSTMESWDVIVIGAGPSAQRAAIASHDSGAKTVMIHQAPGTITPISSWLSDFTGRDFSRITHRGHHGIR